MGQAPIAQHPTAQPDCGKSPQVPSVLSQANWEGNHSFPCTSIINWLVPLAPLTQDTHSITKGAAFTASSTIRTTFPGSCSTGHVQLVLSRGRCTLCPPLPPDPALLPVGMSCSTTVPCHDSWCLPTCDTNSPTTSSFQKQTSWVTFHARNATNAHPRPSELRVSATLTWRKSLRTNIGKRSCCFHVQHRTASASSAGSTHTPTSLTPSANRDQQTAPDPNGSRQRQGCCGHPGCQRGATQNRSRNLLPWSLPDTLVPGTQPRQPLCCP